MVSRKLCSIFWMRCNSGLSTTSALFLLRLPLGRPGLLFCPAGGFLFFRLVLISTALWSSRFSFGTCRFGFLGLLFCLAGGFFFCCADHLFHTDRIRPSLLGTDQGQREKGQPWYGFLHQAGEKVIQTVRLLACFCNHTLISRQQIGILIIQQVPTEECPEYLRPRNDCVKETLHRSVATPFLCPS